MPSSPRTKTGISTVISSILFLEDELIPDPAIVEQVRDGTQLRVRLILDDHTHQFVNLVSPTSLSMSHVGLLRQVIAGAKSPRASSGREGDPGSAEPFGEEVSRHQTQSQGSGKSQADLSIQAKFFTELRLLQRPVKVRLLSAPAALGASPFSAGPTPAAASAGTKQTNGGLPAVSSGATVIIGTASVGYPIRHDRELMHRLTAYIRMATLQNSSQLQDSQKSSM